MKPRADTIHRMNPPLSPQSSAWSNQIPPGMGRLVVDASFPSGAFLMNGSGPRIVIDGVEHRAAWGPSSFDLPPGNHRVRVSSRYLGDTSPAETVIPIVTGQEARAYYKAAMTVFTAGSIGPQPQPARGMGCFLVMILVPLALSLTGLILAMNGR